MPSDYGLETLADANAVLVIDKIGFLKQDKASCGVGRQYTGSAGKVTNCRIGVFAAYVSHHGHAFIDRAPYLAECLDERSRPAGCGKRPGRQPLDPDRIAAALKLVAAGLSPTAAARQLCLGRSTIYREVSRAGIQRNP